MGTGGLTLFLASALPVVSGNWIGLGSVSAAPLFARSSVVIPVDATITGIVLNVRDNTLAAGDTVTATVFTSPCGFTAPVNTGVSVTLTGPNPPTCCAATSVSAAVITCDLLSVQITISGTVVALNSGVSVTIFFTV